MTTEQSRKEQRHLKILQRVRAMPVISIRQPWAHHILYSGKAIENRTFPISYRGRIWIHTGAKPDDSLKAQVAQDPGQFPMGGIIGSVRIFDMVQENPTGDDPVWWQGPVGWRLSDPKACEFYKMRGRQGLFYLDPQQVEDLAEQFRS